MGKLKILWYVFKEIIFGRFKINFWDAVLLNSGSLRDLKELSEYQKEFLERIKKNFIEIDKKGKIIVSKIFHEFYLKEFNIKNLEVCSVELPKDNLNTWELSYECLEDDCDLIVVLFMDDFEISGSTLIH